jgi:transposase InsO family protein
MDEGIRRRLKWVLMYQALRDAGLVCRRCGISRPTLRKWVRRYQASGESGLIERSRRPNNSPRRKIFVTERELILSMRQDRNIGARRIQSELRLYGSLDLSITAVQKVLRQAAVKPLRKPRRTEPPKRYSRPIPGDRIQMDTMKVAPGVYQYTAVDDCSRFRVLAVYPRRNATFTLDFLERLVEEMPFAIQRIQTDRGGEFFAEKVQRWLMDRGVKFRPIPPRSPHLNGKVERSQLTDLLEFWARVDPKNPDVPQRIEQWQFDYNWRRPHGSLSGKTPIDRINERLEQTPTHDDVSNSFDVSKERIKHRNWHFDRRLAALFEAQNSQKTSAGKI